MRTIQKICFCVVAVILFATNANAGRWLTRDPIEFMERDPKPTMPDLSVNSSASRNLITPLKLQIANSILLRLASPIFPFQRQLFIQAALEQNQNTWPNSFLLRGNVNLYTYVDNNPVNEIDPNGLWGIMIGGRNFGHGDPTFNFDFNKQDWADLRNQYRLNEGVCLIMSATANKASAVNPNPLNWGTASFFDGALLGSAAGYGVADFGEAFSSH